MPSGMIHQAQPIFAEKEPSPDTYYLFAGEFETAEIQGAMLEISADSTFELFINDQAVLIQQLADFPDSRTYSRISAEKYLRIGKNRIRCGVHYIGDDFLTCQKGIGYLQLVVYIGDKILAKTDGSWLCAKDNAYTQSLRTKVTGQLGFTFEYHADAPETSCDRPVTAVSPKGELHLRQVPQLELQNIDDATLSLFGVLKRPQEESSFALTCMRDFCAPRRIEELFSEYDKDQITEQYISRKFRFAPGKKFTFKPLSEFPGCDGYFIVVDLGRETVGYITLDLEAPEGTIVDITHGEHLDDGRVRAFIGNRNFGDRYHCRAGRNCFTTRHRRFGCRYIELHITQVPENGTVSLNSVGLAATEIPLPEKAAFSCEDSMIGAQRDLAIRTLTLCMHEHYEDCPWREQSLYGYDSRNQMLFGYYVWGNFDFAAASLDLLGKSFDGERYLTLTAPGTAFRPIPIFTMAWITALSEHMMFSGSFRIFDKYRAQVDAILDRALADAVPGFDDLYSAGTDEKYWNFCEWQQELSHLNIHPQSPYNLYLAEALLSASKMHRFHGDAARSEFLKQRAEAIIRAVEKYFFDPRRGGICLSANDNTGKLYEHMQALYLTLGCLPDDRLNRVLDNLENGAMYSATLSSLLYLLRGLNRSGARARAMILPRLRKIFDPILLSGATSLWETGEGGDDFSFAGSLCHAWSGIYPFFCGNILLGVSPLEPGFSRFRVDPLPCGLTHASGEIPTPRGPIEVSWRTGSDGVPEIRVKKPAGLEAVAEKDVVLRVTDR